MKPIVHRWANDYNMDTACGLTAKNDCRGFPVGICVKGLWHPRDRRCKRCLAALLKEGKPNAN